MPTPRNTSSAKGCDADWFRTALEKREIIPASRQSEPKGADPLPSRALLPAIQDREYVPQAQGRASYPYPLRSLRPHFHVSHLLRGNRHLLAQLMRPEPRRKARPAGSTAAAMSILYRRDSIQIPALAQRAGMSTRQFEGRFAHETWLPPKLYARIARFESALESKALSTDTWTNVANRLGYFDQTHMIKTSRSFPERYQRACSPSLERAQTPISAEFGMVKLSGASIRGPQLIL
jgi:AraC-like DNA-binding protein